MQATLTRPGGVLNPFFAHTGVPLGPLPMNADVLDPPALAFSMEVDVPVDGPADIDEVLAARCCSL